MKKRRTGFTIVELLVVVSIIGVLMGILLPALGKAREGARQTVSRSNLRQLGQAHATYAAEWNDRQYTAVDDNLADYGTTPEQAIANYNAIVGPHPPVFVGWGQQGGGWGYWCDTAAGGAYCGNFVVPMNFEGPAEFFGNWRLINAKPFAQYLTGRFYDPVFYAPTDKVVWSLLEPCISQPYEFTNCFSGSTYNYIPSSYVTSPAAMFSPDVFRNPGQGGFQDPWALGGGALRSPSMAQARFSDLKTHMVEHHWLQHAAADCNPNLAPGNFDGCEPFYFNHGYESVPMSLFYDGHVAGLGVREAMSADSRHESQFGWGLWSRDTPWGSDGYLISSGWDFLANTSFHVLTTDGILGRDRMSK